MNKIRILWADDEIDLLKPQLFFLEKKGYTIQTVSNGHDALTQLAESGPYDIIFLDESMPGITGLETLSRIKNLGYSIPVVMVTALTDAIPRVSDQFNGFLRELRTDDLSGSAGAYRLRLELLRRVNLVIAPHQINAVLIEEMLVQ